MYKIGETTISSIIEIIEKQINRMYLSNTTTSKFQNFKHFKI